MSYQLIEHYGVIGDMRTAALVGMDGSIDWCCLPHFDSPSVFAKILDDRKGGFFSLAPAEECKVKQMYLPNTNVLVTRFFSDSGMGEVTDFMSVGREAGGQTRSKRAPDRADRQGDSRPVAISHGVPPGVRLCAPEARTGNRARRKCALFSSPASRFALKSSHALEGQEGAAVAEFSLEGDEQAVFVLRHDECGPGSLYGRDRGRRSTADGDRPLLARLGIAQPVSRPLARDSDAFRAGSQATYLPSHRRHCRGAHHQPSRSHRRRAQLGLPLHLGARRRIYCVFADATGIHRRGGRVRPIHAGAGQRGRAQRRRPAQRALRHRRPPQYCRKRRSIIWMATAARNRCVSAMRQ